MADDQRPSIRIGTGETPEERIARDALGKTTPETLALVDALQARESELSQWLQDPANRKRLGANPTQALAEIVPADVLKAAETAQRLPPEVIKRLGGLRFQGVAQPQATPETDLFQKVWTFVTASQANLAAFQADIPGTVRSVDTAAPQPVVDQVVAAYDQVLGIFQISPVDPSFFSDRVIEGLASTAQSQLSRIGHP